MTEHGQCDPVPDPNLDKMMEMLAKEERRIVLQTLNREGTCEMCQLLQKEAFLEDSDITLPHVHLPKLEETGYIEWNRETGVIGTGPRYDQIEPVLELLDTNAEDLPFDWP